MNQHLPRDLVALRRFAVLMDEAFAVPGTSRRFGLDAVLGLVPGLGDAAGAILSSWVVVGAFRHRVPAGVVARIVGNVLLDFVVGLVPVLGDLFDVVFKENVANVDLVIRHRDASRPPHSWAWLLVPAVVVGLAVLALALAVLAALWVIVASVQRQWGL